MKLKKVMALTLAAVMTLSALAGCGKDDRPASGENNNKEERTTNLIGSEGTWQKLEGTG